jgi:hypothetical protein
VVRAITSYGVEISMGIVLSDLKDGEVFGPDGLVSREEFESERRDC